MQCTARLRLLKYNNDHRTVNICSGHFTCKKSNINIIFRDFFQHRSVLNIHFTSRTSFPFGDQMKKNTRSKVSLASFASLEVFWKFLWSNWTHFGPFKRLLNHMVFIHSRCPNITPAREEFVFGEHLLLFSTYPSITGWCDDPTSFFITLKMFIIRVSRKRLLWKYRQRAIVHG